MRRHLTSAAALLGFAVLAAGSEEDPEKKAAREAAKAENLVTIGAFREELAGLYQVLASQDPDDLERVECTTATMPMPAGHSFLTLQVVYETELEAATGATIDAGYWEFITDSTMRNFLSKDYSTESAFWIEDRVEEIQTIKDSKYLVVVRPEPGLEQFYPEWNGDEEPFDMGDFDGYVQVIDFATNETVCHQKIKALSSESLEWNEGGAFDQNPENVMHRDFKKNFQASVRGAMPSGYTINLQGTMF
jgi:hypothetical protein